MDLVAQPLQEIIPLMEALQINYIVQVTSPTRAVFKVDATRLYVVKQYEGVDGVHHLVVAAKMKKEVL